MDNSARCAYSLTSLATVESFQNNLRKVSARLFSKMLSHPCVAPHAAARRSCGAFKCSKHAPVLVRRLTRMQAEQDNSASQTTESAPSVSGQQQQPMQPPEELPIWVRREKERELQATAKQDLPWPLYLLFSVMVSIAAVGSVFEYFDKNAIFGVVSPESPLWAPILGLFAFTGLPTAGFLFFKGVNAANEAAERQDRMDGYIK